MDTPAWAATSPMVTLAGCDIAAKHSGIDTGLDNVIDND